MLGAVWDYAVRNPIILVNSVGFAVALVSYYVKTRKDRKIQYRANYLSIELESSRIFTVCLQNPDVCLYLDEANLDKVDNPRLDEQAYWLVCQILNIFEIAISLRREKTITGELFETWIPWFFELGTSARFPTYWNEGRLLRYNYKPDLVKVMDHAVEIGKSQTFKEEPESALRDFHSEVSNIFRDPPILTRFKTFIRNWWQFLTTRRVEPI